MAGRRQPELEDYHAKRDPAQTPEPFGRIHIPATDALFVVQQHAATHLHFDLRLELGGVLKSWAVPKGPSPNPVDKRLAMETEDHPLDYADFEGNIPEGNYGAGDVIVWDRGRYVAIKDMREGLEKGKLLFDLYGSKLKGRWTLVRIKSKDATGKEWLLIKEHDNYTTDDDHGFDDSSVLSGLTLHEFEDLRPRTRRLNTALKKLKEATPGPFSRTPRKPMLATSGEPNNRKGWIWELKYDGYRIIASKEPGAVTLTTRNGHTISDRFPEICQVIAHLPVSECIIDGEIVVNDAKSRPSFALMQQRARSMSAHEANSAAILQPATYYAFDLLYLNGYDLRNCTLLERKSMLKRVLPAYSAVTYSEHVADQGTRTYNTALELGLEGVVGKRANGKYQGGRSSDWIKVRNNRTGDFVVVGWSPSRGNKNDIGSVALAEYRGGDLTYVGHAGSGLGTRVRDELIRKGRQYARKTPPIKDISGVKRSTTHWVRPLLVLEVSYTEYTPYGHLRHPAIQRLRDDKSPEECVGRFDVAEPTGIRSESPAKVVTTNPEKVFFPEPGFTKQDLVSYYRSIAPWMLPYLEDRPIVLTRYPDGVDGKSFYQRDVPDYVPDWIRREVLWSDSTEKEVNYFVLRSAEDLAYIANMGTLPIHMWHSRMASLDLADWCVLDLDPKSAPFDDVITLALAIRDLCEEVNLPSFPKTSGASGLHVLIPLHTQLSHEQSRTLGELLARVIVDRHPQIATIARVVRARKEKVYVDFMQNGHGRLIVAPYAVRAQTAGSVSMPLTWKEVNRGLSNDKFHIGNALRRVKRWDEDPMSGVLTEEPDLARSLTLLSEIMNRG